MKVFKIKELPQEFHEVIIDHHTHGIRYQMISYYLKILPVLLEPSLKMEGTLTTDVLDVLEE